MSRLNAALKRAVFAMRNFQAPWAVAGGWALDLFVGRELRPHADIDIAILRADQRQLRAQLSGRVEKIVDHQRAEWLPAEELAPPIHEVHVTWPDGYALEFLLNECDPETNQWVFRRDGRIRRPMSAAFVMSRTPYLAPEIVLLYKSKAPQAKDHADFRTVLPHLGSDQRIWLREALDLSAPGHDWANVLAGSLTNAIPRL